MSTLGWMKLLHTLICGSWMENPNGTVEKGVAQVPCRKGMHIPYLTYDLPHLNRRTATSEKSTRHLIHICSGWGEPSRLATSWRLTHPWPPMGTGEADETWDGREGATRSLAQRKTTRTKQNPWINQTRQRSLKHVQERSSSQRKGIMWCHVVAQVLSLNIGCYG